jgi:hypothetical protein
MIIDRPSRQYPTNTISFWKRLYEEVNPMRIYTWGVMQWMTRKRSDLGNLILERTGDFKKLLEKVKYRPVQKTKRIIVQSDRGMPKGERNARENSIPVTKNPDKIFQLCLVGLGICLIGLIIFGVTYLIIGWAMR